MKAEHRKELQTNTLAASMTRFVQRIKTKPKRRTVLWVVLVGIVLTGVIGWWVIRNNRIRRNSELWLRVDLPYLYEGKDAEGHSVYALEQLLRAYPNTKQGQAALFQYLDMILWEHGIKRLVKEIDNPFLEPADKDKKTKTKRYGLNLGAVKLINDLKKRYERLADELKDDPVLGAEARYNVAVAQESLAIDDVKNLEEAIPLYERVVRDYGETARGKDAKERLKLLQDPHTQLDARTFYLSIRLHAPPDFRDLFEQQLGKGRGGASDVP
jgi:hypothetical protein